MTAKESFHLDFGSSQERSHCDSLTQVARLSSYRVTKSQGTASGTQVGGDALANREPPTHSQTPQMSSAPGSKLLLQPYRALFLLQLYLSLIVDCLLLH